MTFIEKTPLPGRPEQSLAVTRDEFVYASIDFGGSRQAGHMAYKGMRRYLAMHVTTRPEWDPESLERVNGEEAIPAHIFAEALKRNHIEGIGPASREVIQRLSDNIALRTNLSD